MNYQPLCRSNVLVMQMDPVLSAGLVASLRQQASFEVFVHGVDNLGLEGPHIDVVVTDYANAIELMQPRSRLRQGALGTARILVFTPNDREADVRRAIEAGVHGYLLFGGPLNELVDGVTAVAGGLRYMSLSVAQRIAESLTRATLTTRETDVLGLAADGYPNKVIARQLGIELGTVKSHMSTILAKLGATCRTEAARIAVDRGLLNSHELRQPEVRPQGARPTELTLQGV